MSHYVFVIRKPGSDLDGESVCLAGGPAILPEPERRAVALEKARAWERSFAATLELLGTVDELHSERSRHFHPEVRIERLPHWALQWIEEQNERKARVLKRGAR